MRFPNVPARVFPLPILCYLALGLANARAQDATATASVTDTNVEAGQAVEYHIQISGEQPVRQPPAPVVDGLSISYIGSSQTAQYGNAGGGGFRVTRSTTYLYNIDTSRPGRYVIPAQEIDLGNSTVRTSPVALTVSGGAVGGNNAAGGGRNTDQSTFVELAVTQKTAYVGESIPIEVRCYFGSRLRFAADPNPILGGDGFSAQKFAQPQLDTQMVEGVPFNVVKYRTSVVAVKTGELALGPVELEPVVQMPRPQPRGQRRYSSPFDDPFFDDPFGAFGGGSIKKQVKLRSDPVTVQVKPLPPGAPEEFTGAIGQFKLDAEVQGNPRKAQAGDPLTVRALLHGTGNFDRIQPPVLTDENGLQTYPATAKFKAEDDTNTKGLKTFEQVVIPRNARNALPGYKLAYLDPATGKYNVLETPPIPVKITGETPTPTPAPSPATTVAAPTPTTAPSAKPAPTPKAEDILYIRNDPGRVVDGEAFLPIYRRRIFWLAQLAPLALLAGFGALAWRNARARNEARRRVAEAQRLQSDLVRTLRGEKTGRQEFYSAATRLAQLKAAPGAGRASEGLTAVDVCRATGLESEAAASLEEIFHRRDELAYSGGRAAAEIVPVHERRDVLATLETVGKL